MRHNDFVTYSISCLHNLMIISGAFYYVLGNVSPRYRSQLKGIQLVCMAPVSALKKQGIDAIMKPIVEDIKKLEKVLYMYMHVFL